MRANKGGKLIQGESLIFCCASFRSPIYECDFCFCGTQSCPGQDLQKQLEKEFKFVPVIKYKDPEGDKVSMKKQGDFEVPHRQTLKAPC